MPDTIPNLWPDFKAEETTTPLTILKQQAAFLGEKTKGLVRGEILTNPAGDTSDKFMHEFRLVAPALGQYRYHLFTVRHDVRLYPVVVFSSAIDLKGSAASEAEFLELLARFFGNEQVQRIIQAMISQSIAAKSA